MAARTAYVKQPKVKEVVYNENEAPAYTPVEASALVDALQRVADPESVMLEGIAAAVEARAMREIEAHKQMLGTSFVDFENRIVATVQELVNAIAPRVVKIVVPSLDAPQSKGRKVEGFSHAVLGEVIELCSIRQHVLLVGPAGCGKTYLAEQVADALGLPFGMTSFSSGTSESHLQGYLLPIKVGGVFAYVPSVFVERYEKGGVWLGDEIDAADENMLLAINAALSNGFFFVPQRVENPKVKRHDDFVCIAAANTFGHGADMIYAGRNKLDGATLDRFRAGMVKVDYDPALETATVDPEVLAWGRRIRSEITSKGLRRVMSTRVLQGFTKRKNILGHGKAKWEKSYFADWTRDELVKVGVSVDVAK